MYYGDDGNGNDILLDRRNLDKPMNRAVFGVAGIGKTILLKHEMLSVRNTTEDTIFVIDLFGEYGQLAEQFDDCVLSVDNMMFREVRERKITIPDNRGFVVVDLSGISDYYKDEAILFYLKAVWDSILLSQNPEKRNWLYLDDFTYFMKNRETAKLLTEIFARARTNNCIVTIAGNSFKNFYGQPCSHAILTNTPLATFLRQYKQDRELIQKHFGADVSHEKLQRLWNADVGTGITCMNHMGKFVPFRFNETRTQD